MTSHVHGLCIDVPGLVRYASTLCLSQLQVRGGDCGHLFTSHPGVLPIATRRASKHTAQHDEHLGSI